MNQASHEIAEFKAVEDDPQGLFAARVSVIGNVDRNGDRIMEGAFDNTKAAWIASGKKIPVIWSHEHKDPNAYIGFVDPNDITISGSDIIVAGKLDVKGNPLALRAFNLLQQGLVNDWSFAYKVNTEKVADDGAREIFDLDLFEVGPTLIGANGETGTLAVASDQTVVTTTTTTNSTVDYLPLNVEDKQVDNTSWDGAAAMAACDTAADYRAICAGERSTGEPDERQHWALPHHKRPGAAPNAGGVRNALSRLPQTQGLSNREAAEAHLNRHMGAIRSEAAEAEIVESKLGDAVDDAVKALDAELEVLIETKIGRVISKRTETKIRDAVAQLTQILSSLDEEIPIVSSPSEKAAAEEPAPPSENELARRRIRQTGLFLSERNR